MRRVDQCLNRHGRPVHPHALKLVRGLRKQITDLDERVMTTELLRQLHIGGWEVRKRPDAPSAGFTFEPPTGPEKQ
jgi:hypothetical protein